MYDVRGYVDWGWVSRVRIDVIFWFSVTSTLPDGGDVRTGLDVPLGVEVGLSRYTTES